MLTAPAKQTSFAFPLDTKQSMRVLEQALRSSATITLTPKNDDAIQFHGPIDRTTPESLWIAVGGQGSQPELPPLSVCCEGALEVADGRYLFDTNVLAISDPDGSPQVEVALPACLRVVQRRRFWRAQLQQSTAVRLSRSGQAASEGETSWQCSATLMNVSVEGLACRMVTEVAEGVAVGQIVKAVFQLHSQEEPFVVDARVKSKIPAGTDSQTVMGLQFLHAEGDPQHVRLQTALERLH